MTPRRCLVPLAFVLAFLALPTSAGAYVYWGGFGSIGRVDNDGANANPGFLAGADGTAPIAVDDAHLYFTTDAEDEGDGPVVARTNLDGGEATALPEGFPGPSAAGIGAVDAAHIYWTDDVGIGRAKLDGSDPEPEFLTGIGVAQPDVQVGGIAVYDGFIYWTVNDEGAGEAIGRANLASRLIEPEAVDFDDGGAGPRAIAVDADGIFWTMEPAAGGPLEGAIGHVGLGGGTPIFNDIPGADATATSGLAISGSDLYWFNFEGGFGISLAHAELHGAGSTIDRHFVDHVGFGWIAVNSTGPPPVPPPPPPPSEPPAGSTSGAGSSPPPTSGRPSTPTKPKSSLPAPKVKLNAKAGTATLTGGAGPR